MQSPTTFSRTLDAEMKRIAKQEDDRSMEELTEEIAQLVNRRPREIYNWRSGKWSPATQLIPILCRRFGSVALAQAVMAECTDVTVIVPEGADIPRMVSSQLRSDMALCEGFLKAYESDGVQEHELRALREMAERVNREVHQLVEVAAADCEQRSKAKAERRVLIGSNQ